MAFSYGFAVHPIMIGVKLDRVTTDQRHPLGSVAFANNGKKFRYVKSAGTIELGNLVKGAAADDPYGAVVVATASAAATAIIGMAPVALASGDYAWILESGVFEDDAQVVSANVANGDPFVSDANGDCDKAAATDINNARGIVVIDDTDNTGTVLLF